MSIVCRNTLQRPEYFDSNTSIDIGVLRGGGARGPCLPLNWLRCSKLKNSLNFLQD